MLDSLFLLHPAPRSVFIPPLRFVPSLQPAVLSIPSRSPSLSGPQSDAHQRITCFLFIFIAAVFQFGLPFLLSAVSSIRSRRPSLSARPVLRFLFRPAIQFPARPPRRLHLPAACISPSAAALRIRIPAPVRPLLRSRLRPRLRPIPARHSAGRIKHSLPLQAPVPGKQPPPLPGYSKKIPAPQTRRRDFSFSDRNISPPEYPC